MLKKLVNSYFEPEKLGRRYFEQEKSETQLFRDRNNWITAIWSLKNMFTVISNKIIVNHCYLEVEQTR